MSFTLEQRAANAAAIDSFLGTNEATTSDILGDVMQTWWLATIARMKADEAAITVLQQQVTSLTTAVSTLQAQVQTLLSTG